MTAEVGSTATPARESAMLPDHPAHAPAAPAVGRGATAAAQHRDQREGLAHHRRRPVRVDLLDAALRVGAASDGTRRHRDRCGGSRACAPTGSPTVFDWINRLASGWARDCRSRSASSSRSMVFRRWRHLFTFVGSVLVLELARPRGLRPDLSAAPVRRDDHRSLAGVRVSIRAGRGRHDHRGRHRLLDGRSGSAATDREACCRRHHRGAGRGASLSRGRSSLRHPREHRGRGRAAAERVPVLRPQRGVPGLVPARQDRAPRRRWAPR